MKTHISLTSTLHLAAYKLQSDVPGGMERRDKPAVEDSSASAGPSSETRPAPRGGDRRISESNRSENEATAPQQRSAPQQLPPTAGGKRGKELIFDYLTLVFV